MSIKLIELLVAIVAKVIDYGPEAVSAAITALQKDDITLEDIEALKDLVKPPETY